MTVVLKFYLEGGGVLQAVSQNAKDSKMWKTSNADTVQISNIFIEIFIVFFRIIVTFSNFFRGRDTQIILYGNFRLVYVAISNFTQESVDKNLYGTMITLCCEIPDSRSIQQNRQQTRHGQKNFTLHEEVITPESEVIVEIIKFSYGFGMRTSYNNCL